MIIGVLNSTYNGYTHGFRFDNLSSTQSNQDSGVTVQAGITRHSGENRLRSSGQETGRIWCEKTTSIRFGTGRTQ